MQYMKTATNRQKTPPFNVKSAAKQQKTPPFQPKIDSNFTIQS